MTIKVNQEPFVSKSDLLSGILEEMNLSPKGIAVAVNNEVIPRLDWEQTVLKENDHVMIIKATQGG